MEFQYLLLTCIAIAFGIIFTRKLFAKTETKTIRIETSNRLTEQDCALLEASASQIARDTKVRLVYVKPFQRWDFLHDVYCEVSGELNDITTFAKFLCSGFRLARWEFTIHSPENPPPAPSAEKEWDEFIKKNMAKIAI